MALHGDRFDRVHLDLRPHLGVLLPRLRLHPALAVRSGEWPKRLDRAHVGFSNLSQQVEDGARGYASRATRSTSSSAATPTAPSRTVFDRAGPGGGAIEYFNTGCWVDRPASFVTVGAAGVALNHCP